MAKYLAVASALAAPAVAFVPTGSLRASSQTAISEKAEVRTEGFPQPQGPSTLGSISFLALSAAGIAAGALRSSRKAHAVQRRVAGIALPLTEKFDPLNMGNTDAKMERYTAVEIKHGRTAMIAVIGYVMPEIFRFPGCEKFENGLGALSSIPVEGWVQMVALVGAHEILVKPRAGGLGMYDLGFGTEVLEGVPAEEVERRQTSERNNGRLAMVAILGTMVQDGMFGKTPWALMRETGLWGPNIDWIIKDIPVCGGGTFCALKPAGSRIARSATALRAAATETKMSPSMPFLEYPEQLEGWVGGEKGFDPLNVTWAVPVYLTREAELKHGRVAMLATIGWIATDLGFRFQGDMFQNVSTIAAHDKFVESGLFQPFLATVGVIELYGGWLCLQGWFENIQRESGDFFLGKNIFPKDPEQQRIMRLKELENGRLAMFAIAGIATQAVLTKSTWPFM